MIPICNVFFCLFLFSNIWRHSPIGGICIDYGQPHLCRGVFICIFRPLFWNFVVFTSRCKVEHEALHKVLNRLCHIMLCGVWNRKSMDGVGSKWRLSLTHFVPYLFVSIWNPYRSISFWRSHDIKLNIVMLCFPLHVAATEVASSRHSTTLFMYKCTLLNCSFKTTEHIFTWFSDKFVVVAVSVGVTWSILSSAPYQSINSESSLC